MNRQKVFIVLFCVVVYNNATGSVLDVDLLVHPHNVVNNNNENFLSVALDTIVIAQKLKNFNTTNHRLIQMVSYLAPGYLRIGGNLANRLYFSKNNTDDYYDSNFEELLEQCFFEEGELCSKNLSNFTMYGHEWKTINSFAKKVGLIVIFDVNCLIRNDDGSWNSKNAHELIKFSSNHGFKVHWQLGNEPDAYKHLYNYTVNATQLAKDYSALKTILKKYPKYKQSLLVGPEVTRPKPNHNASIEYLKKFLNKAKPVLDAVSWHQYYLNGREATIDDFLNPETFHLLETQINITKDIVNKTKFNNTPIWLSETGSAYGGGAPGLSDRFVASFLWLDKLGLAAKNGLQTVVRQSLFKGHYALIDENYDPSPDWWISVFHKRMVGPDIIPCSINDYSTKVRLYCQSTKIPAVNEILALNQSAVTVFGVNIDTHSARVNVKGLYEGSNVAFAYIFRSYDLRSKDIFLNGVQMVLSRKGKIPAYKPIVLGLNKPLYMPPYSVAFWIIPVKHPYLLTKDPPMTVVRI